MLIKDFGKLTRIIFSIHRQDPPFPSTSPHHVPTPRGVEQDTSHSFCVFTLVEPYPLPLYVRYHHSVRVEPHNQYFTPLPTPNSRKDSFPPGVSYNLGFCPFHPETFLLYNRYTFPYLPFLLVI